jgi:hypothetical protein
MSGIHSVKSARGAVGAAKRWHKADLPERHRDLEVSKLKAHIQAVVDSAPPPTPAQAKELARLLTPVMLKMAGGEA